jgi:hypothetical protein
MKIDKGKRSEDISYVRLINFIFTRAKQNYFFGFYFLIRAKRLELLRLIKHEFLRFTRLPFRHTR